MHLLEIKELQFHAGPEGSVPLLAGLNMTIGAGEVHALLGTNGTGKSTLAYLIMGCEGYRPMGGALLYQGESIAELPIHERARRGISLAWQEPVRFEGITVRDYLTLRSGTSDPSELLELVGLQPAAYLDRMVDRRLSGGERKRIELASILALKPLLAVLDEPDSGIDMLSTQDIINVISVFKQNGSAVLLITHREEIARIADRASQLCNGRIVCTGSPEKVAQFYKSRRCLTCAGEECIYV